MKYFGGEAFVLAEDQYEALDYFNQQFCDGEIRIDLKSVESVDPGKVIWVDYD